MSNGILGLLGGGSYRFGARIQPLLFFSVPVALTLWAWTEEPLEHFSWLMSLAVAAGIPTVLSEWAADQGRRKQAALWESWGGAPTTQLLRHRGDLNPHTRARYHAILAQFCPDLRFPSPEEETTDPQRADSVYSSCVDRLRVHVREHATEFPTVSSANVAYGFRRNLWAIRGWGIAAALVGVVASGFRWHLMSAETPNVLGVSGSLLILVILIAVVRRRWVREAAFTYARRLIECSERLPVGNGTGQPSH